MASSVCETSNLGQNPGGVNSVGDYEEAIARSLRSLLSIEDDDTNQRSHAPKYFVHEGASFDQTKESSASNTNEHERDRPIGRRSDSYYVIGTPQYFPTSSSSTYSINRGLPLYDLDSKYYSEADYDRVTDLPLIDIVLKGEQCPLQKRLIYALYNFVFTLMVNEQMYPVYVALVDACNGKHLDLLIRTVLLGSKLFLDAAFCQQGVKSIIKLVTKLKRSRHAFTLTAILSERFFDIMTDHTARRAIQQCFIHFGHEPSAILYEKAIHYSRDLATHKVGCRSLNECINTIVGEQRSRLLNCIADATDYLSVDPYGNYVVQFLLDLNNKEVTAKILSVLKGQHIKLAQHKVGSNVVEKCMERSETGLADVVKEILRSRMTPFLLARNHFGNYVVQRALRTTKERGFNEMYEALVNSLKPYYEELSRTPGGSNVMDVIEGQLSMCRHRAFTTSCGRILLSK